jgi:hypothetical protein
LLHAFSVKAKGMRTSLSSAGPNRCAPPATQIRPVTGNFDTG